jgi:hypothetical protein
MRLRISRRLQGSIDGVAIDHLQPGVIYEIGTHVASVLLAEGWAEPVADSTLGAPRPPPKNASAVVLVVDDESDLRQLVAELL